MRVIAGLFKGRKLVFKKSKLVRPTQDRVKETLFNIISDKIVDGVCLDLFAGSGSLGIEALSRGAKSIDFVDIDVTYVIKNLANIKADNCAEVFKSNAANYIKKAYKKYDIIFLDPPWSELILFERSLKAIFEFDILNNEGIIICEHPQEVNDFYLFKEIKQKKIGNKNLSILEK